MKIIELTKEQFSAYSKIHSSRNYYQTVEYANLKKDYKTNYLGFVDETNGTLMAACLLLEKTVMSSKVGYVPGNFLIDYSNEALFKDFINNLKTYLKNKNYIYLNTDNLITYKIFDNNDEVIYFDTNLIKMLDELSFVKVGKTHTLNVVLETEKTPNETYKLFNKNTKRNIKKDLQRAIHIFKDESNNPELLLNLSNNFNEKRVREILENFNSKDNKAELYFAKIDPETYVNNYRYLLKEEEEINARLTTIMQDTNIHKSDSFVSKKMASDKLITRYNSEIVKATNLLSKYPEGIIIGAILIIKNNREIYFLEEGRNKEFDKLYSSHLLKWEIIKKYLTEGYKIFNFGNIKSMDKKNSSYIFKTGFGGKVYECVGSYDLIINKFKYNIIKLLHKK